MHTFLERLVGILAAMSVLILVLLWVTALSCVGQAMEQGWGF